MPDYGCPIRPAVRRREVADTNIARSNSVRNANCDDIAGNGLLAGLSPRSGSWEMDMTMLPYCACLSNHQCREVDRPANTDIGMVEAFAPAWNIALLPSHDI